MSTLTPFLTLHTASVQTYQGAGPTGDSYATSVDVTGFLDDGLVLVASATGQQLESKTVFYTDLANASLFSTESLVSCNGRNMQVTAVRRRDGGSLLAAVSHLEVDLT